MRRCEEGRGGLAIGEVCDGRLRFDGAAKRKERVGGVHSLQSETDVGFVTSTLTNHRMWTRVLTASTVVTGLEANQQTHTEARPLAYIVTTLTTSSCGGAAIENGTW